VRQLEWLARSMIALHDTEECLTVDHLPPQHRVLSDAGLPERANPQAITGEQRPVDEDSGLYDRLVRALDDNGGVVLRAAEALGITRQKAYRILEKQGVELDQLRRGRR
jgi:transcriptional regulator of acetoin/glycerol metabolism